MWHNRSISFKGPFIYLNVLTLRDKVDFQIAFTVQIKQIFPTSEIPLPLVLRDTLHITMNNKNTKKF